MGETFDLYRYIRYAGQRWKFVLTSCAVAIALAVVASLLMTREYTATARIVIEPPAGTDQRSAMAVSPIYLESLKTYEEFAGSDSLFRTAVERLHLRDSLGAMPIESMKRKALKVALVRNTRILEISATMPDPRRAHELAQFIAESSVSLNQTLVAESDRDLTAGISADVQQAREHLNAVEAEWSRALVTEPTQDLQADIDNASDLRSKLQHDAINAEVDLVDAAQREKQSAQSAETRAETADARARLEEMRKQLAALDSETSRKEKLLGERMAHREHLEAERKAAQTALASLEGRVRESRADAGYRGERLKIVDPGIVPERPSSPNLPLNVAAALLLGTLLPLVYLAFEMNFREERMLRGAPVRPLARAGRE
ncbi:MAG TPA: Wzz/FepE/Etk N-terminal domain-containing protein [Candidatus Limnocylindrales bacterium]|nr:Wzz/FepE/Etk N-terminal domain-containing protein [Candidatus Limnocylindrales bacterium]